MCAGNASDGGSFPRLSVCDRRGSFDVGCRLCSLPEGTGGPYFVWADLSFVESGEAALVTSGTATLETALLRIPQVVCYNGEGGRLSYYLFKTFVKVDYISLVNLIFGGEVVKELMMHRLTERNILNELSRILYSERDREKMLRNYDEVIRRLGQPGASARFAKMMVRMLRI